MNVYDIKFKASTWMKQSNFRSIKELRQYTKKRCRRIESSSYESKWQRNTIKEIEHYVN